MSLLPARQTVRGQRRQPVTGVKIGQIVHMQRAVHRSLQIESTAVIFCCGSKTRRGCLIVFMVYILSRIVDKFFLRSAALAFKEHSDFALLGADHNRLILNLLYQYHPALLRKKESMASIQEPIIMKILCEWGKCKICRQFP